MKTQPTEIRLIVCDFDGLFRSASWEGLMAAYIEVIKAKGKDPGNFFTDLKTFKMWFDMDWHRNIERIDGRAYIEDPAMNALFHTYYDPYVKLFPWVKKILQHYSKKYHLAIFSSSSVLSVEKELGNVARLVPLIVGAETVTELKPHPEGLQYIMNRFGVLPGNTLMIGDTAHDINAGFAAGTWTGAVSWGLSEWDELLSLGAEFYFTDPSELFLL